MFTARLALILGLTSLTATSAVLAQQSAKAAFPNDAWIQSLPTGDISVGDLTPKWGPLTRTAEGSDAGSAADGATGQSASEQARAGGRAAGSAPGASDRGTNAGIISPAPGSASEIEPNNTFGTAQRVGPSTSVRGTIDPAGDYDAYSFEVPRRGCVEIRLAGLAADLDATFRVHDWDNRDMTGWRHPKISGGATETEIVDLPEAGRYYIYVADNKGKAKAAAYTIQWTYRSGDRNEPNETFGSATEINANDTVAMSTYPLRDYDWFTFTVENQGIATVQFQNVPEDLDVTFRIHDGDGRDLTGWRALKVRDKSTEPEIVDLPAKGRYYLEVADQKGDARSPQPYTLRLKTDLGDTHEPNGSIGAATHVAATGSVPASLLPLRDYDWFHLEVDNQGLLEVVFNGVPDDIDIAFRLHDADGRDLTGWRKPKTSGGNTETEIVDLPGPGSYYLVMTDESGDDRSPKLLTLQTKFVPADQHESNASVGRATPISLGAAVQANLLPVRDYDHFVVEVPRAGTLDVRLSGVSEDLDPALRIHDFEGRDITGWQRPKVSGGTTEPVTAEVRDPGRYYVIVTDDGGDDRVRQPYSLTVSLQ